jgi:hypothetical protein
MDNFSVPMLVASVMMKSQEVAGYLFLLLSSSSHMSEELFGMRAGK